MDFVTFGIAKKLKEKGFKEECLCHYIKDDLVYNIESPIANNQLWFSHNRFDNIWHRDHYDAPTISQVLKWLREDKGLHIEFVSTAYGYIFIVSQTPNCGGTDIYHGLNQDSNDGEAWDEYKECELAGIEYVLNNFI